MNKKPISADLWERIDVHLSRSEMLRAIVLYRETTGCSIAEGKDVIGNRFRERFPQLWAVYRNLDDDD
ncbi:MAG: hypothetical protein ABSG86_12180 [Thermoguttaceae bacterium]|jgi:hypothetical protein